MRRTTVHIVPHTHWDREWYLTRQRFSLLLVRVVDRLIDILDSDPDYPPFMFDGQTIALEDYLELRPDAEEKMRELITAGRVLVGPWYVLPDEVLISGEAHIRNYLTGMGVARKFGGGMSVGYLPDSFGHPSQMPQILRGLGLREIVFWRGLGPDVEATEFEWTGFDGSTILGINMVLGYGVGAALPKEPTELANRITKRCGELASRTLTESLLLMNGVDHMAPERELPSRIAAVAGKTRYNLRLSTLPEYLADVRKQLSNTNLPQTTGELRSGYRAYLLGGTLSTRMYLKQLNARVESILEAELEPLLSVACLLDSSPYPAGIMRRLWRGALANLPHDSICGCSIDAVHEQMVTRYQEIIEGADALRDEYLAALSGTVGADMGTPSAERVILFNPHPFPVTESIEMSLDLGLTVARRVDHNDALLVEYTDGPPAAPASILLKRLVEPATGPSAIQAMIVDSRQVETLRTSLDDQPVMFRANRVTIRFVASDLPPCGYRVYEVVPEASGPATAVAADSTLKIENEYVQVTANEAGTFSVLDKRTGTLITDMLALEDGGDAGDEYTYCPPAEDSTIVFGADQRIRKVDGLSLRVCGTATLPAAVTPDRKRRAEAAVECPYAVAVRLQPGSPRLDVTVDFTNNADDHILKIVFPTGMQTDRSRAGGTFCVTDRTFEDPNDEAYADWVERPSGAHPQKGFVTATDGQRAVTVFSRGLPEYEFRPLSPTASHSESAIAVTLLRCVGQLSRLDLPCRPGNAGWPLDTPGAQCHGSHRFELALLLHPEEDSLRIPGMARVFATPPIAVQGVPAADQEVIPTGRSLPPESWLMSIDNPAIVLGALKQREAGDGFVARLVNPHSRSVEGVLRVNSMIANRIIRAFRSNLAEVEETPVAIKDGAIEVKLRGGEIHTLCLIL